MSPDWTIGLVTVTYNGEGVLEDFLQSVDETKGVRRRLYVVDNASSDRSLDVVRSWTSDVPTAVIANDANLGVAAANNQGIRAALEDGCDAVLVVNNDTVFDPTMLQRLLEAARESGARVITPAIAATDPVDTIWYAGGRLHAAKGFKVEHERLGDPFSSRPSGTVVTEYAPTCCLLVDASVFREIGLMSEEYFVYSDDVDFAIRLQRAGIPIHLASDVAMVHKASSSTGGPESPFGVRWTSRNWVLTARRHASPVQLVSSIAYIQAWAVGRMIIRHEGLAVYRMRLSSYWDGFRAAVPTVPQL